MLKLKLPRLGRFAASSPAFPPPSSLIRSNASDSWSAVQDIYFSAKEIFERHRVVFTVATSAASLATAWAGYSIRHYHQRNIEKRLESIEQTMKSSSDVRHEEIRRIVSSGSVSLTTCLVGSWTSLIIGYGLGWRGGSWFARRKFQRAQMKLMGQPTPGQWQRLKKSLTSMKMLRSSSNPHLRKKVNPAGTVS